MFDLRFQSQNYTIYFAVETLHPPVDLKIWKSTGSSFKIEIHFSIETTKFLVKYNLLCFQISGRPKVFFTENHCQVSISLVKENKRHKWRKIEK
jgi:hypothetical protein